MIKLGDEESREIIRKEMRVEEWRIEGFREKYEEGQRGCY